MENLQSPRRTPRLVLTLIAASLLAAAPTAVAQNDDNRGTVKVHDSPVEDPDQRNVPHVTCDFYVEGFNMKDPTGTIVFYSWPPTGDKSEVTPTGDTLVWTGTPDGDGEYDFLKGPYFLPAGHYRVEVYTDDGHPGHEHFAKAKMFWVDPCGDEEPVCVEDCDVPPDCPEDMPFEECEETEIPFFPGFTGFALASLGAAAMVGLALRRRS
ncbi:MAG TPA: hypothetical protein VM582_08020 [Candidatus Thermoplasmatota archaeon]|nr:hypothetical protein [Candidatus Thermoplasmatota archaeon]